MSNVTATIIGGSVLAVETDVLYQWRTLLPTYVRRLTPVEELFVSNVRVQQATSVCSIATEREMPVRKVRLHDVRVAKITGTPTVMQNVVDA